MDFSVFLISLAFCLSVSGNTPEGYHRCGDASCSSVIAKGRTTNKYMSGANGLISFNIGQDVLIYSKEGKGNSRYWSVEINGVRGFAPKNFIIILEEINRDLKYEVPMYGKYEDKSSSSGESMPTQQHQPPAAAATAQNVESNVDPPPLSHGNTQYQPPPASPPQHTTPPSEIPSETAHDKTVGASAHHIHAEHRADPVIGITPSSESSLPSRDASSPQDTAEKMPLESSSPPTTTTVHGSNAPPLVKNTPSVSSTDGAASSPHVVSEERNTQQLHPSGSSAPPLGSSHQSGPDPPSQNAPPLDPLPQGDVPILNPPSQNAPSVDPLPQGNGPILNPPSQNAPSVDPLPQGNGPILNPPSQNAPPVDPLPQGNGPILNPPSQNAPSVDPLPQGNGPSLDPNTQNGPTGLNPEKPSINDPLPQDGPSVQGAPSEPTPTTTSVEEPLSVPSSTPPSANQAEEEAPLSHHPSDDGNQVSDDNATRSEELELNFAANASGSTGEHAGSPMDAEFEKDGFFRDEEDEEDDDEEENEDKASEDKKTLVNQVLEEFSAPDTNKDTVAEPGSFFGFYQSTENGNPVSSQNNEDNHVETSSPPSTEQSYEETQHYDYMGESVHLPQGSEELNESVGQKSSPDMNARKPLFNESPSTDASVAEDETMNFFDRLIMDIYPSWVHDVIHVNGFEEVSPEYTLCMMVSASTICIIYFLKFIMDKTSRESPLKARVALLDKQLFQVKNDNLIIKKQLETNSVASLAPVPVTKTIVKQETPSHILAELEQLKEEREKLLDDSYNYQLVVQEKSTLEEERDKFKSLYEQSQQELLEAENIVQECLEEKKYAKASSSNNEDMLKALQSLEDQLNNQKQAVLKYESKVKKRESELKEKIQELRKLRADAANAKLETDRVGAEKEGLLKRVQALEGIDKQREVELDSLRNTEKELKALKTKLGELKEDVESKESELEAKNTEIEVLNNTIGTLKCIASASESENHSSDGWEFQDTPPSIDVVEELSRCKVDLKKASEACNSLSEQLTKIETERDELQSTLQKEKEEWEVALKVKEQVLNEKNELEHKHSVLSNYFNQREAELQKQLGLQSARLNEVEAGSESSSKKMSSVCEELESYKSQVKTLKLEMEEMERSWKSQNASLEKKQHESWVTVRQEARRNAEAQNEMQTLRSKLTVTEAKILEKEAEIKRVSEENAALRETIQNIASKPLSNIIKPEPIYPNGHSLSVLPPVTNGKSSGTPSVSSLEPPPPELPPLPFLPPPAMMPMMPLLPHNQSIMDTHRPAPVGRRSPTRGGNGGGGGRYSRSPSPGGGGYYPNRSGAMFRDSSPGSRSDRSRFDYSPSPPTYRRHSSRERSPDRFSTRSDRSDLSHHIHHHHPASSRHRNDTSYRDTPPRDPPRQHYHRSSNEFPGSGLDDDEEYPQQRSKRNSNRPRNNNKNSRTKNGPKTSSPMVDGRDLNI